MDITKKEIRLKSGESIPAGSEVTWVDGNATVAGRRVSALTAARALGVDIPTEEDLNDWVTDSSVLSILGYNVELDGIDPEGSPSWFLAMGLI